jgi:hypothetical protein
MFEELFAHNLHIIRIIYDIWNFRRNNRLIEYIPIENDTSIFDGKLTEGIYDRAVQQLPLGISKSTIQKKKKSSWNCKPPPNFMIAGKIKEEIRDHDI